MSLSSRTWALFWAVQAVRLARCIIQQTQVGKKVNSDCSTAANGQGWKSAGLLVHYDSNTLAHWAVWGKH